MVERDFVEEDFHVFDGVDGNAGFSDVAGYARMVGIVAAVSCEVEGDAQTLLAGGEVAAVECVGIFGGGKSRVLADGPGTQRIHRGVGAAEEWRDACGVIQMLDSGQICSGVEGLYLDAFGGHPFLASHVRASCQRDKNSTAFMPK